ncbi:MAG: hypothetical protein IKD74_00450 [Clostridia bacterium]|nr:hypothetical protein [Clostridia bacterium]
MFFEFFSAKSYIDVKYEGRIYLEESFEKLKSMMNDNKDTITVHVVDTIFTDVKTFKKSEITRYGSY